VSNVDGCDVQCFGAKGVREMYAESGSADGEMDDLAKGRVGEVFRRQALWGSGICCEAPQEETQLLVTAA